MTAIDDEREALRAALFGWWDTLSETSEVVADPLLDVIFETLASSRRGQITDEMVDAAATAYSEIFGDKSKFPSLRDMMRASLEAAERVR